MLSTVGKFSVTIEYNKMSSSPENVFFGIAKMIEAFKAMDAQLITCVDSEIDVDIILDDIEKGSIKVWLSNLVKRIPDDALENCEVKRIIGVYLKDAKYYILRKCSTADEIADVSQVEELENGIMEIAKHTGLNKLDCYQKPNREQLLQSVKMMGDAYGTFNADNKLILGKASEDELPLNKDFRISDEKIKELCASEAITNVTTVILKVRKPDFLGETAWTFKHGNEQISAKIADVEWLRRYLSGEETIVPGDSLRVELESTCLYDKNGSLVNAKHKVVKVLGVVRRERVETKALIK